MSRKARVIDAEIVSESETRAERVVAREVIVKQPRGRTPSVWSLIGDFLRAGRGDQVRDLPKR